MSGINRFKRARVAWKVTAVAVVAALGLSVATAEAAVVTFTWQGDHSTNWQNASNWGQNPGNGDIPDDPEAIVEFDSTSADRLNVGLSGVARTVKQLTATGPDAFRIFNGILRLNDGAMTVTGDQQIDFDTDLAILQVGNGTWNAWDGSSTDNLITVHGTLVGAGEINARGNIQLLSENPYEGKYRTTTHAGTYLGNSLALKNAFVSIEVDQGIGPVDRNLTFGALGGNGDLSLAGYTLTLDGYGVAGDYSGDLTSSGGSSIIYSGMTGQTFSGNISGVSYLQVNGSNVTLESGDFTFDRPDLSGALVLNNGDLNISLGADVILDSTNANGGTAKINSHTLTIANAQLTAGRILSNSDGVVSLADSNNSTPALVIGKTGANSITSTFAGELTGTGSFRKVGAGTWTLNSANTFSGKATIDEGTVKLANADALQNAFLVVNVNDAVDLNGFDVRVARLGGNAPLDIGDTTFTFGNDLDNATYTGLLSGTTSDPATPTLIKTGTNRQTFTAGSDLGVPIGVEQGFLRLNHADNFTAAGVSQVGKNGILELFNGSTFNAQSELLVGGSVDIDASTLNTTNLYLQDSTSASLSVSNGAACNATNQLIARNDEDTADYFASGAGTTVHGAQLGLGPATGNGNAYFVITDSASVTFDDSATINSSASRLIVDGASFVTDRLTDLPGEPGTILVTDPAGGHALTVGINGGSSTFNGLIADETSGPGSLEKTGGGAFTLIGANTFTGGVTISGGTLLACNTNGTATGTGGVVVQNSGTIGGTGFASGLTTVNNGGSISPGQSAGTLTLDAVNFATGASFIVEIGGTTPGTEHDQLVVNGAATLGGALDLRYLNSFVATPGQTFTILTANTLTGSFDSVIAPDGHLWFVEYDAGAGTVVLGLCADDDSDGVCNADDVCPGFDDNVDTDNDTVPDGCDLCPGFNDLTDFDGDGVPAACDRCDMFDDALSVHNLTQDTYPPSIQAAIDAASNGDVIQLAECDYFEDNITFPQGVNVTIQGGAFSFINGGNDDTDPVFFIDGGLSSAQPVIADLRIYNSGGPAIQVTEGDSPTIRNVFFHSCTGPNVLVAGASTVVDRCIFFGSDVTDAVARIGENALLLQCVFFADVAPLEVFVGGGQPRLVNCTIVSDAIAIEAEDATSAMVTNSIILGDLVTNGSATISTSRCLYPGATGDNIDGLPTFPNPDTPVLVEGSLGIDAADYDAYLAAGGGSEDVVGQPRTHDDAGTVDTGSGAITYLDIGALEFQELTDSDDDGVGDATDVCPGFDDNVDTDTDGIPNGCDACAGGPASGDANADSAVDLDDYAKASVCLTGPGGSLGAGCECFDFDTDGDSDLADFAEFQIDFTSP